MKLLMTWLDYLDNLWFGSAARTWASIALGILGAYVLINILWSNFIIWWEGIDEYEI